MFSGCFRYNPYETGNFRKTGVFAKTSGLPFVCGTKTRVMQGAFGKSSHDEPGNEYSWDLEIPENTPVLAVEDGVVIGVYAPSPASGGCDKAFSGAAWNVQVEHKDGSVAQYVHISPSVSRNDKVNAGKSIGSTNMTGWICYPHLHFGVYRSAANLYSSRERSTVPVMFREARGGILMEGGSYTACEESLH